MFLVVVIGLVLDGRGGTAPHVSSARQESGIGIFFEVALLVGSPVLECEGFNTFFFLPMQMFTLLNAPSARMAHSGKTRWF